MFFDPDETYDLLFAQKIAGGIQGLLSNALDEHGLFGGQSIWFIDRLVPNPINPWCSDWSGKMFDFLKKLSITFILEDDLLNGAAYGFEQNNGELPNKINLKSYLPPPSLAVTIPANSTGVVTWQEIDSKFLPFCDKVTNLISITRRRGQIFRNTTKKSITQVISTSNWLHNSVCFSGVQLELTDNQAQFLLYSQMQSFLDYLWEELGVSNLSVLTGYTASATTWAKTTPIYSEVPDYYYHVYLRKEGVNYGKPLTVLMELTGKIFSLEINYIYYQEPSVPTLTGVEIGPSNFFVAFDVPNNPTSRNVKYGLYGPPSFESIQGVTNYFLETFGVNTPPLYGAGYAYSYASTVSNATHGSILERTTEIIGDCTNRNGSDDSLFFNRIWGITIDLKAVQYGIPIYDPNLFNSCDSGLVSSGNQTKTVMTANRCGFIGDSILLSGGSIVQPRTFYSKFRADYGEAYGVPPETSMVAYGNSGFVTVSRRFGIANTPPAFLIFETPNSLIPIPTPIEELVNFIYPNGIDNPSIFDPDTDGGDIMPDSIRLKEIHAALEADRYGVHPSDPEKKRFNNLGRYLETLAYATGIAFNEDGKNIPQPESNWIDAEYIQTINANQSLRNGQFAVREVTDAYGQRMVCDALFEVRTRKVTTSTDDQGNLQVATTSPGGAMRVPHIGGIFDTIQDDLTKYWGGGDIMVPKVDGTGVVYYDSMGECLADALYMLGSHSQSINELQNQSLKSVFLLQEIFRALGLPCHVAAVKGVSPSAPGGEGGVMPCPELDEKSPTLASLLGLVLINLSRVVGSSISFREDDSAPPPPPGADPEPEVGGVSA